MARLLVTGASNNEIAGRLGVEVVTAEKRVGSICRKLEAPNQTQATVFLANSRTN